MRLAIMKVSKCLAQTLPFLLIFSVFAFPDQQEEKDQLGSALKTIITNSFDGFKDLRAGPGRAVENEVAYPCSVNIPGSVKTLIYIPRGKGTASVEAQMYVGKDEDESQQVFSTLVNKLEKTFPDWGVTTWEDDSDSFILKKKTFESKDAQALFEVSLTTSKGIGTCRVRLNVAPIRRQ